MVVMELGLRIMNLLNQGKYGGGGWVLCRSFPIAVDNDQVERRQTRLKRSEKSSNRRSNDLLAGCFTEIFKLRSVAPQSPIALQKVQG